MQSKVKHLHVTTEVITSESDAGNAKRVKLADICDVASSIDVIKFALLTGISLHVPGIEWSFRAQYFESACR